MKQHYKEEINEILNRLGEELDISKTEYDAAKKSYEAVGNWLSSDDSPLAEFNPEILPQGSFRLGTVIKPINEEDDIDIDLVCMLDGKPFSWTQYNLKEAVGDRLKDHGVYRDMIEDKSGGRRCWTLEYSNSANYHMDILPSITSENYKMYLSESFSNDDTEIDVENLAIRITDKEEKNYKTERDIGFWNKSNPFGYAKWFYKRAIYDATKMYSLNEAVEPVDDYSLNKLPLQRVVQLLKRHRDIMFLEDQYDICDKPISIIITTLAARAYDRSDNILDAFSGIVSRMRNYITEKHNPASGKTEKWVVNPINPEENFADKWSDTPQKEEYFFDWLDRLEADLDSIKSSEGIGMMTLNESFSAKFGEKVSKKAFSAFGENKRKLREEGLRKMSTATGMLGSIGDTTVKNHNFYGSNE